ncbi:MAG: LLM class flavin-dependent oxidoreductase [Gemmataceae bacterium]|nr:LLM class flavin-dependent oxidoreductase [Gemmataceae bacterium]
MKFYFFHLMSWPHLPDTFERDHDSAWVWTPNSLYDPVKGHALYSEYIDTLALADELGFDGVCVNEHHQTAYGLMPSPNLIASALIQRTKRCRIAVIGNALPLYDPPLRVAEEFAMLDVMSGGRLNAGMVVGGGPEYFTYCVDPTTAREKFAEALELIVQAWTRPGPFPWNGKHYFYRYVNPWPTPYQKPHPPIWIPGAGSVETVEMVAKRRFCYMGIPYFHIDVAQRMFDLFRDACSRNGYTAHPEQMGWGIPVYVAETDKKAREKFEPHFWYFIKKLLRGILLAPPGYTSAKSAVAMLKTRKFFLSEVKTWDEIERGCYAIVGSPETVRQKLEEKQRKLGAGVILTGCQVGAAGHELTRKSMRMLATEVMPKLRPAPARGTA